MWRVAVNVDELPNSPDDPRLDGWYHTIELGGGLVSRGVFDHRSVVDRFGLPESLAGKTVLDVGAGDGFFSFEMERRGAARVVALDLARLGDCDWLPRMRHRIGDAVHNQTWPTHLRMARAMLDSRVEQVFGSVYELSPYTVGLFDVVFCGSLLLHLQNPLAALVAIRSVTTEMAIIETAVDPNLEDGSQRPLMTFGSPNPEDEIGAFNTHWIFSTAALEHMLRAADFTHTEPQGVFDLPPAGPTASVVIGWPGSASGSAAAGSCP